MKLKLNNSEFECLYGILAGIVEKPLNYNDLRQTLMPVILIGIYQKFRSKDDLFKKPKYTIKLQPHEAVAWWIFFTAHSFAPASYEGNLLNIINNNIHQQYQ